MKEGEKWDIERTLRKLLFLSINEKISYLYQRNLRRGKEILIVATIQISSVQR